MDEDSGGVRLEFLAAQWGNLLSGAGLAITIWLAMRAKTAAEQARDAALQMKNRMATLDTLSEVSGAIELMGEIKTLQRLRAWDLVLDRYGNLRRRLVRIEQSNQVTSESHRTQIVASLGQFRIIERKIESARGTRRNDGIDSAKFNDVVSKQIDSLESVMIAIKKAGL